MNVSIGSTDRFPTAFVVLVVGTLLGGLFFFEVYLPSMETPVSFETAAAKQAMIKQIRAAKRGDLLIGISGEVFYIKSHDDNPVGTEKWVSYASVFGPPSITGEVERVAAQMYDIISHDNTTAYAHATACMLQGKAVLIEPASARFTCGD